MKKAIIIGASSGVGLELAKHLSQQGYVVGLAARRVETLQQLLKDLPGPGFARRMDITDIPSIPPAFDQLIADLGGMDICFISAGVDHFSKDLSWPETKNLIDTNVTGFAALANHAFEYLSSHGGGHITSLSSIAALRGSPSHPAYCASKAFVSNYTEGLRLRAKKKRIPVTLTDARPGYINTPMSKGQPGMFWILPPDIAAKKIYLASIKKKPITYLTPGWRLIAVLMRHIPQSLHSKI